MVSKYNTERKYLEGQENRIATAHPNTPRAFRLVGYEYQKVAEV